MNSPEGNELEVLGILLDHYETESFPIGLPNPIEAIEFSMKQMGYNKIDLVNSIGLKSRATEILNR